MTSLRDTLKAGSSIIAPGVGDPLGALAVAEAGFTAAYLSGYYVSACLGYPDVGLVTMSEMVEQARRVCRTTSLPVIADADTGYGSAINVIRTVREYEAAGVSGIHLEDQTFPKRCGDMEGMTLIPRREMCTKLQAALDARKSPEFIIIARTDSLDTDGIGEAIARGQAYREAGADAIMIHGLLGEDDLKRCRQEVDGPLVLTVGSRLQLPSRRLIELGYQIILYPITLLRLCTQMIRDAAKRLHTDGVIDHSPLLSLAELHAFLGLEQIHDWESQYALS